MHDWQPSYQPKSCYNCKRLKLSMCWIAVAYGGKLIPRQMQIKCEQGKSSTNRCKWEKEHIDAVRQHVEGLVEWHKASVAASIKMLFLAFYFRTTADNISVLRQQHKQPVSNQRFLESSTLSLNLPLLNSPVNYGGLRTPIWIWNYGMCCQVGLIVHTRLPWMYAGAGRQQTESHMYILK